MNAKTLHIVMLTACLSCCSRLFATTDKHVVYIEFVINRIDNIDYVRQTFEADFYLDMWWKAPYLGVSTTSTEPREVDASELLWKPENDFQNIAEIQELSSPTYTYINGYILAEYRYKGIFFSNMDLRSFPFDQQVLSLKMEDAKKNADLLVYRYGTPKNQSKKGSNIELISAEIFETPLDFPEFKISNLAKFALINHRYEYTYNKPAFCQASLSFVIQRKSGFYINKIIFGIALFVLSGALLFFIDSTELGTRLSYGMTVLLTMIGHNYLLNESLPKISYQTILDYIIFISNGMLFLFMLIAVFIAVRNSKTKTN